RTYIDGFPPKNLVIVTASEHDIPWELIYDGKDFWCNKYNMGRVMSEEVGRKKSNYQPFDNTIKIAVISSDPEGKLPSAKTEGKEIERLLKNESNIAVDVFDERNTSKIDIIKVIIGGNYDVIHYAGHAEFDIVSPKRSSLKLLDGDLTSEEIARISFPSNCRPIIFANACSTSKITFTGDKTIGLASAFVISGALAFVGTMWPIKD